MKILIAGAGIGGLALAALLRQRGVTATLLERAPNFDHSGYMLGLWPVGARVLHGLGLMPEFLAASERMRTYTICNGHGEEIHHYPDLGAMLDDHGYSGGLMRGELLRLLRSRCEDAPLRFGCAVESFEDRGDEIVVRGSDGSEETCDLLVGADGIHSTVRRGLFGSGPDHDTGWGCWVWIVRGTNRAPDAVTEYWGTGRLVGAYPIKGGLGVVGAGPTKALGPEVVGRDGRKVREYLGVMGPKVADLVEAIPDDLGELFWWRLSDYRCEQWVSGRVALLGDAACAFLPTAGVGASMALESAAVLNDELSRTDAKFLPAALDHYERRRKRRAEAFQDDSRKLGSMMMLDSAPMAWGRDQLLHFYTLEMLAKSITKSLGDPI
jgi:2-polyprenyl-6-methoxyphenol hydroxylase-like FAD-dependent oxidoreductase